MKELRKELIDFAKWYNERRNPFSKPITTIDIDKYLKSINSEAGDETPTVTDNEAKKEVCQYCNGSKEIEFMDSYGRVISRKRCHYC